MLKKKSTICLDADLAKCSCCGHIHHVSNPVEHLPSECPDCHSIMDEIQEGGKNHA